MAKVKVGVAVAKVKRVQKYCKKKLNPRRELTQAELESYHRDGYVVIKNMFTTKEAKLI